MAETPALAALLKQLEHPALATIDLSLGRMERYLAAHNNPQDKLPPVIHVAGTNGKGSTIAYLRAILEAAGYCAHVYTSPHLVHFRERIVLAGKEATDEQLLPVLQSIADAGAEHPLTFFEATTAAAMQLFAETPADFTLLEVGMGGRFDATNCVAKPALTIITPVSLDHMEFLGADIASIAHEKAGIIKTGVPVVMASQQATADAAIRKQAAALQAPVIEPDASFELPTLSLAGTHQPANAQTAIAAIRQLREQGYNITDEHIRTGLQKAEWPARLQKIEQGALREHLLPGQELWLDGGHNIAAAEALADWASRQQDQPLTVIMGMVNRKDPKSFMQALAPHARLLIAIEIPDEPQTMSLASWEEAAKESNIQIISYSSLEGALEASKLHGGRVLVCGSLYLAGKLLEKNT